MNPWMGMAGFLALPATAALVWQHRRRRDAIYRALAARQTAHANSQAIEIIARDRPSDSQRYSAAFAADAVVRIDEFVSPFTLTALRDEALSLIPRMEHTCIPHHKQGNTLSYESIMRHAPHCRAFYHNPSVQQWISGVTGLPIHPTPVQDQSSLSVLCYKDDGDHINWHYDHNFYRGRHFTVLLSLVNRSQQGGLSSSRLERQLPDGRVQTIDTSENTLVVFEGVRVRHRATPSAAGDLRVILSMTYCADPRISTTRELLRRIKDTAFYGVRALWD
jgi:hypothetical protein